MALEHSRPGRHQSGSQDDLTEAIKICQVLPILVVPHVDGAVNGQPRSLDLGHETHGTVTQHVCKQSWMEYASLCDGVSV